MKKIILDGITLDSFLTYQNGTLVDAFKPAPGQEKEVHAAGFQPMPGTQRPGSHVGRLEQSQAGGRIQGERRQARPRPVGGEHDEAGDLCLPACAG